MPGKNRYLNIADFKLEDDDRGGSDDDDDDDDYNDDSNNNDHVMCFSNDDSGCDRNDYACVGDGDDDDGNESGGTG